MNMRTFRERVAFSIRGEIADVTLARPERMNALDGAMFDALADVLDAVAASQARVVVLSGAGGNFCAGLDTSMFAQILKEKAPDGIPADFCLRTHGAANLPQHVAMGWRALDVPVIAALERAVLGGGLQIALGADVRIVAPAARLAMLETRWGLVPDMGAYALALLNLRDDVFRELLFTRRVVRGDEAVRLGLATRVADAPYSAAVDLAQQISRSGRSALAAAKRLAKGRLEHAKDILLQESTQQQILIGGVEQLAAVRAAPAGDAVTGSPMLTIPMVSSRRRALQRDFIARRRQHGRRWLAGCRCLYTIVAKANQDGERTVDG